MKEHSYSIPFEIIPDKYIFRRNDLSKVKTNNSFLNKTNKRDSSILEENKNIKLNPLLKSLSLKNKIKIKLLGAKFNSKRNNNSSFSKPSDLIISNDEKTFNKKIDIKKLKPLLNISKINKVKNENIKNIKYDFKTNRILKKNNSFETSLNKNIKVKYDKNEDLLLELRKHELKERLSRDMKKHFIIDKETLREYDALFKRGLRRKKNQCLEDLEDEPKESFNNNNSCKANSTLNNNKSFKININNNYYKCFSVFKSTFRYEDYYFTPLEFLKKYFRNSEIVLMKSFPAYFGLNKAPFKDSNLIFKPTLLQKIEYEDKIKNKNMNKSLNIKINKDRFEIKNLKKCYSERKIRNNIKLINISMNNKKNRKKIKFIPFIPNYEREIAYNEGTTEYFEQKFEKYIENKKKRIKEKIENQNYKKNKFEFLKNEHVNKMNAELEIHRQSRPVLESIRKNYVYSNFMINYKKLI